MDWFFAIVFSAAFIGLVWHGARWAFHVDKAAPKHRRKHKKRKADPETDATFFNIIGPLTGTHISDWFKK